MFTNAAVLGAGSWGTALSVALADRGLAVSLYGNEPSIRDEVNSAHRNSRYLPEVDLPPAIRATTEITEVKDAPLILLVVPSQVARIVLTQLHSVGLPASTILVNCTKGIDPGSGKLMHELIEEFFPENPVAVLSGPSHAEELIAGTPTTVVACAADPALAVRIQGWFFAPALRVYTSDDVLGVELGGSIKNIIAIAAGISDGMGFGDNTRAALMTRGLAEMVRLRRAPRPGPRRAGRTKKNRHGRRGLLQRPLRLPTRPAPRRHNAHRRSRLFCIV